MSCGEFYFIDVKNNDTEENFDKTIEEIFSSILGDEVNSYQKRFLKEEGEKYCSFHKNNNDYTIKKYIESYINAINDYFCEQASNILMDIVFKDNEDGFMCVVYCHSF